MPLLCSHTSQSRTLLVTFSILHILSALMGSRPFAPLQIGSTEALELSAGQSVAKTLAEGPLPDIIPHAHLEIQMCGLPVLCEKVPSGSASDVSSKGLGYLSRGWGWTRQHFTINLFIPYYKQRHGYAIACQAPFRCQDRSGENNS